MSLLPARFQTFDDISMSLGKAIAAAIAPKVDPNAWFDAVARQYPDDKPPKAARTVEDVLSDPTEDEMQYVIKLRGGCRCSWPNAAPPCSICTTEYSEEEAAEALAECWQPVWPLVVKRVAAPPSTEPGVKFKAKDRVKSKKYGSYATWAELTVTHCTEQLVFCITPKQRVGAFEFDDLELIEPAPSPASETETEGWVTHWPGDPCPIPGVHRFIARFDLPYEGKFEEERTHALAPAYWAGLTERKIVAYKVLS